MYFGIPAPLPIPFLMFRGRGGEGGWFLAKSQIFSLAWLYFLGALVQGHLKFTVMQLLIFLRHRFCMMAISFFHLINILFLLLCC